MRYDQRLDAWVAAGLVSAQQAEAIRRHEAERHAPERRDRVVAALAVIGAVVGGLGVILFFAANWDAIPRPARVTLVLATMVGAYASGYLLRPRRPAVGQALLLLGALVFGASFFLVGQMYHVQAHDPLAFLVWSAACLAMALVVRTRPLAVVSILAFGAWLVAELDELGGGDLEQYIPVVAGVYGVALYAWGTLLREPVFSAPMRVLGFAFGTLGVFVFTFRGAVQSLGDDVSLGTVEVVALVALSVAALSGAALLARRAGSRGELAEACALLAVPLLLAAVALVPETTNPVVYPLLFNVVLAALALGAIAAGYLRDEAWLVNAGIALVAIDVFARYVDFFWELLPRSLGFLGAGAVLLTLAFGLERQRGRLLRGLEARP